MSGSEATSSIWNGGAISMVESAFIADSLNGESCTFWQLTVIKNKLHNEKRKQRLGLHREFGFILNVLLNQGLKISTIDFFVKL